MNIKEKLKYIYYTLRYLKLSQVRQFFYSLYRWVRSGFKVSKVAEERLDICKECPHYKEDRCSLCGCHTPTKTRWFTEECPIEKW
jgi:hypothetical protein|tara:strand:+ start:248 stop:502 length:255 start_codon:yes stop_codon:yes gene_type:complete